MSEMPNFFDEDLYNQWHARLTEKYKPARMFTLDDMVAAYIEGFMGTSWKWNGEQIDYHEFEGPQDCIKYFREELESKIERRGAEFGPSFWFDPEIWEESDEEDSK